MEEDASEYHRRGKAFALLRALRPALPAVIGAAALTFLFAAVMPMAWVAAISWNLYLDRLSELFVPPVGNAARLALALGMAAVAALIAGFVALLIARPEETGVASLGRRLRRRDPVASNDSEILPRRRADFHPDDPPRPPIRAGRDLPAEGLVPAYAAPADEQVFDLRFDARGEQIEDELILDAIAPLPEPTGDEPWLQPADIATGSVDTEPAMPDTADKSLGAMVARFEAGLARRREERGAATAPPDTAANEDDKGDVDLALEAALGTLQRLNRHAVG